MGGEHGRDDPQVPDYAGKDGGLSGGPGGHARERLDEFLAQRLPAVEETEERDDSTDHTTDADSETATEAWSEQDDERANESTDLEPVDTGEDEPQ